MNMRYEIPEYLEIPESQKVVLEVLDDYLNDLFGFHTIVPIATFDNILKVKPSFNVLSRPLPKQKDVQPSPSKTRLTWTSPKKLSKAEIEIKPEIRPSLKLEVAKAAATDWKLVQEVAECMEEILSSLEAGLRYLPQRQTMASKKIVNQALKQKMEEEY